jgi:hypothetical protein
MASEPSVRASLVPSRGVAGAQEPVSRDCGSRDAATCPVPADGLSAPRLPHAVTPLWAWAVITAACLAVVAGAVGIGGGW